MERNLKIYSCHLTTILPFNLSVIKMTYFLVVIGFVTILLKARLEAFISFLGTCSFNIKARTYFEQNFEALTETFCI